MKGKPEKAKPCDDFQYLIEERQRAAKISRDSKYRITALTDAVTRAGQDGGLEGGVDVLALAELYYNWLLGSKTTEKPVLEKMLKGE